MSPAVAALADTVFIVGAFYDECVEECTCDGDPEGWCFYYGSAAQKHAARRDYLLESKAVADAVDAVNAEAASLAGGAR